MSETFTGKVWVLGDDIDTDIIIPTEYLALKTVEDMKPYAFSPLRPELAGQIEKGDIIVAGKNFGCGSSREHAPLAIKCAGVSCVIAETFARIFLQKCHQHRYAHHRMSGGGESHRGRRRGGDRFRQRRDHQQDQKSDLPGAGISALHAENHIGRRPGELH